MGTARGQFTTGVVRGMAERVAEVRAELSAAERRTDATGKVMAKGLRKDLLVLESRLADAQTSNARSQRLTREQSREVRSLVEDSGYSRADAVAIVRAGGL